jgi:hypothetical protein
MTPMWPKNPPVPDRRGEVWEEVSRPEHAWGPGCDPELERFVVVNEPQLLEGRDPEKLDSWWHPVFWLDDVQVAPSRDPEENGVNEVHFGGSGLYAKLSP